MRADSRGDQQLPLERGRVFGVEKLAVSGVVLRAEVDSIWASGKHCYVIPPTVTFSNASAFFKVS